MVLSYGVWLIVLGILGASNLIIAKKPNAKELIGKMVPYQGWFGVISVFYGVWELIGSLGAMGLMAVKPPFGLVVWILMLANALLQVGLGFLLGIGVMKTFIKSPSAQAKMDQTFSKMAPFQGILGLAAIGVGAAFLVLDILFI
jgi:hypothetical protein